tara:strand:+ start:4879 stop:5265 length:387 start_codon:yes stop_codon:yes gene_type:complete
MATQESLTCITLEAGADLSGDQYKMVKLSAAKTIVLCSNATDAPVGVLQNKPGSGEAATVAVSGACKLLAGGTVNAGDFVGTDASGTADAKTPGSDTTEYVIGRALTGAASGEVLTALINTEAPHRAS